MESLDKLIHGDVESPFFGVRKIRFPHRALGEWADCPRTKKNGLKTACGQKTSQNQGKFYRLSPKKTTFTQNPVTYTHPFPQPVENSFPMKTVFPHGLHKVSTTTKTINKS